MAKQKMSHDKKLVERVAEVGYEAAAHVLSWNGLKEHHPEEAQQWLGWAKTVVDDKRLMIMRVKEK